MAARKGYLVPVQALSVVFRGMFLGMLRQALPQQHAPQSVWTKPWVVYCKPAVQGSERVLQYLARYVHRVAFANSRLVRIEDGQVTFRYQVRKQRQWKTMTLPATEFIRRFLQHVLPRGTHKVRYYGFWNPSHRALLRQIQLVTGSGQPRAAMDAMDDTLTTPTDRTPGASFETPRKCPCCGEGILVLISTIRRHTRAPP